MIYIFLAEGFEAIEAITTIDMLIRAQIPVTMVSVTGDISVGSSQGIVVNTDALFEDVDFSDADMLIFPGGQPGTDNLCKHKGVEQLVINFANAGKPLAAICAGPTVLGRCGALKGRRVTVFPGNEDELTGATCTGRFVEEDGNIITAIGPAASAEFANAIIRLFRGKEVQDLICDRMQFNKR